jgi:uncharacterized protein DUF6438
MMRMVAAGVLLSLTACARREVVPLPADRPSNSAASVAPAITLERTACFGACPVYTISVSPSGEVTYEGKAHVRRMGAGTARVPRERVDSLLSELEQAGYFSFADRYLPSEPACGRAATDAPTVTTSVTLAGRTKQIAHYYGCSSVPGALTILEQKIDETLNSGQWTGH